MAHLVKTYIHGLLKQPKPGVHIFHVSKTEILALNKVVYSHRYSQFDRVQFSTNLNLNHDFSSLKSLGKAKRKTLL